jgi:cytidine deaminase
MCFYPLFDFILSKPGFILLLKSFKLNYRTYTGITMSKISEQELIEAAREARKFSKAKYSKFKVGAALLTADDEIITGCNVESSSYSLTICAERVALTKALSEGKNHFKSIAIAALDDAYCPPCGACRQMLFDYAPDIDVLMADSNGIKKMKLTELLPLAFDESQLGR